MSATATKQPNWFSRLAHPGHFLNWTRFLVWPLAVATAIALYGPESGAALATVVGVLVEVPVMLSVCHVCLATKHWFPAELAA